MPVFWERESSYFLRTSKFHFLGTKIQREDPERDKKSENWAGEWKKRKILGGQAEGDPAKEGPAEEGPAESSTKPQKQQHSIESSKKQQQSSKSSSKEAKKQKYTILFRPAKDLWCL